MKCKWHRAIFRHTSKWQRRFLAAFLYIRRYYGGIRIENYCPARLKSLSGFHYKYAHGQIIKYALKVGLAKIEGPHLIFLNLKKAITKWLGVYLPAGWEHITGKRTDKPGTIFTKMVFSSLCEYRDQCSWKFQNSHWLPSTEPGNSAFSRKIGPLVKDFGFRVGCSRLAQFWGVSKTTAYNYLQTLQNKKQLKLHTEKIYLDYKNRGNYSERFIDYLAKFGRMIERETYLIIQTCYEIMLKGTYKSAERCYSGKQM